MTFRSPASSPSAFRRRALLPLGPSTAWPLPPCEEDLLDDTHQHQHNGVIHLWVTSLEAWARKPIGLDTTLSPAEIGYSLSLLPSAPEERVVATLLRETSERFVIIQTWLRTVLGEYLGVPPYAVPITVDSYGNPRWQSLAAATGHPPACSFTLAWAGPWALCAVSTDWSVGVDLELENALYAGLMDREAAETMVRAHAAPAEWSALIELVPPAGIPAPAPGPRGSPVPMSAELLDPTAVQTLALWLLRKEAIRRALAAPDCLVPSTAVDLSQLEHTQPSGNWQDVAVRYVEPTSLRPMIRRDPAGPAGLRGLIDPTDPPIAASAWRVQLCDLAPVPDLIGTLVAARRGAPAVTPGPRPHLVWHLDPTIAGIASSVPSHGSQEHIGLGCPDGGAESLDMGWARPGEPPDNQFWASTARSDTAAGATSTSAPLTSSGPPTDLFGDRFGEREG